MATPRAASTSQNLPLFTATFSFVGRLLASRGLAGSYPNPRRTVAGPTGGLIGYDWGVENTNFTIRPGRREDAAAAARLWMQSAEEHAGHDPVYTTAPGAERMMRRFLADLASSGHTFLFVAESGDRTVGFVSGELREGSPTFRAKAWASIDDVFVEPEHRNLGVGRALIGSVRTWAKDRGADGISLQVAAANERARKFYREMGFREISIYELLEF